MNNKNYSIRLSEELVDFIVQKSRRLGMFPSEYVRFLIQREMNENMRRAILDDLKK